MLPDYLPLRFPHRHPLPLPRPQRDDTSRGVVRTVAPNTGPVDVEAVVQNCRHGDLLRPIALKDDVAIPSAIPAPRPLRDDSTNGTILLGERLHNAQINAGILPVIRSTTPFSSQPIPRTRRNILIPKPLKLKDDVTGGSVRLVVPGDGSNVTVEAGVETHKGGSNGSPLQNAQPHGTINQIPGLLEVQGAKQSQTSFETTHQSTRFSGIPVSQQGQSSGGSVKMVVGPKQGPVTVVAGVQNSRRPVREVERLPRMIDPLHRNHMHPLPVKKPSKMNRKFCVFLRYVVLRQVKKYVLMQFDLVHVTHYNCRLKITFGNIFPRL